MSEFDDEIEEGVETEGSADSSGETESPVVDDPTPLLEALAQAGGDLGKLAADLLEQRKERLLRQEIEASYEALADSATEPVISDLLDRYETARVDPNADPSEVRKLAAMIEDAKEALRFRETQRIKADDENYFRLLEAGLRAEGYGDETVAQKLAEAREDFAAVESFRAGEFNGEPVDVLHESESWNQIELARYQNARARALAEQEMAPSWDEVVAAAQSDVDQAYADVLTPAAVGDE